jgi:non-heme chloroperoxidase
LFPGNRPSQKPEDSIVPPTVRTVSLPSGIRLPYVEQGEPGGVPIIFLHGITDSWRSFEPVLPRLPASVRAFAVSQRGHGDADRPETGYRPADFAEDLAAFMQALDLGPAVVVGHSMGGSVAQRFAVDHPEKLLALVLVGSRAAWHDQPDVAELCDYVASTLRDPVARQFALEFQQSTLAQPVPEAFLDMVVQESLKLPARVWRSAFLQGVQGADHRALIAGIRAPTLLICGECDTLARGSQETLADLIRGSRLEIYARAGHALHWEEPARFVEDLLGFIGGLGIATGVEPSTLATRRRAATA